MVNYTRTCTIFWQFLGYKYEITLGLLVNLWFSSATLIQYLYTSIVHHSKENFFLNTAIFRDLKKKFFFIFLINK